MYVSPSLPSVTDGFDEGPLACSPPAPTLTRFRPPKNREPECRNTSLIALVSPTTKFVARLWKAMAGVDPVVRRAMTGLIESPSLRPSPDA
jgi:hypothetical protein